MRRRIRVSSGSRWGFLQLMSGTLIGQVVTFFTLPLLVRIYSPDEYGAFSIVCSIAALLAPIFILGMDQALVRPKSTKSARKMAQLGLNGLIAGAVVSWVIIRFAIPNEAFGTFDARDFSLMPIVTLVFGLTILVSQIAVREESYSRLGVRNTVQSLSTTAFQITAGIFGANWGINGLLLGFVLGGLAGVLFMGPTIRPYIRPEPLSDLRIQLSSEWRYPVVFGPSVALAQLAQQFPLLFVAFWYGAEATGQVGMAERLIAVPVVLIGGAGAQVFMGRLAKSIREESGDVAAIYVSFCKRMAGFGAAVFLGCVFLAQPVVPIFLGSDWTEAARIVQIMAGVALGRILATPLVGIFKVLGEARLIGLFEAFRAAILTLLGIVLMSLDLSFDTGIAAIYATVAALDLTLVLLGYVVAKRQP